MIRNQKSRKVKIIIFTQQEKFVILNMTFKETFHHGKF